MYPIIGEVRQGVRGDKPDIFEACPNELLDVLQDIL
jgi:hypothetical protein